MRHAIEKAAQRVARVLQLAERVGRARGNGPSHGGERLRVRHDDPPRALAIASHAEFNRRRGIKPGQRDGYPRCRGLFRNERKAEGREVGHVEKLFGGRELRVA